MVQVVNVKLESIQSGPYHGVLSKSKPQISWEFTGDDKDWFQNSYEVSITYDSGEVAQYGPFTTSTSNGVDWPGRELNSKESVSIAIRVQGKHDEKVSQWSESNNFQVGVLNNEWSAPFIKEKDQKQYEGKIAPETLFRSPIFKILKPVKSAKIFSTALGIYELEINGAKVSNDYLAPGWTSYEHRLLHQVYDITDKVGEKNVLGARVASGWYSGFLGFDGGATNIYGFERGLSLSIEIIYEDGTTDTIQTDESWSSNDGPIINAQLYNGETYDSNLEIHAWSSSSLGENPTDWKKVEIINKKFNVQPQNFGYIVKVDTLKPKEIFLSKSGKTLIDFGQNSVGFVSFKNLFIKKDEKITLRYAEVLENEELGSRPLRTAEATDVYIANGDPNGEGYTPRFTFHGFRYVEVDGWPGNITENDLELHVLSSKLEETGTFKSSNEKLNRLHQNVFHSTRGNFLSIPMDCPQRDERLGWLGDIAVFAPTALYLFDSYPFLRSWLKDLSYEQIDNGGYPSVVVPDIIKAFETGWNGAYCAIWQDASVIVPYRLYEATGRSEILIEQYESMKTWFHFIPKTEGKIRWDRVKFQLGDWLDPNAPPDNPLLALTDAYLVADAFLYLILVQLESTALILNKEDDHKEFNALAKRARLDFHEVYVTNPGKLTSETQTAYSLAIAFNLLYPEQIAYAGERLSSLVESNNYKIGTGFAGTPFILDALVISGHIDDAYKMLLEEKCPSWLYPVSKGATTIWERWDSMLENGQINPGDMTSFNHYALGAVATWIHEKIGGVVPISPGWKQFKLKPLIGGGLTNASTSFKSPYGVIESAWTVKGDIFDYKVRVPHNTQASIELPDGALHNVGSGTYEFQTTLSKV